MKKIEMLFLSLKDVQSAGLTMRESIEIMEKVFQAHGKGKVTMPAKISLDFDGGRIGFKNAMPAYVRAIGAAGIKWAGGFWNNPKKYGLPSISAIIILDDVKTGFPIAIMEGSWITAMRTGAVTAVGAKYLARKDSNIIGIVGAGVQGRYQLMALNELFNIKKVKIADKSKEAGEAYAKEMNKKLGLNIRYVQNVEEAVRDSDVLVTATTSHKPFVKSEWLKEGNFTCAIGSYREIEDDVVLKADKVVVDNLEQCMHRGNLSEMFERCIITEKGIYAELGEIVACRKKGRVSNSERTLLVPIGMGSEDIATASRIYQIAIKKGLGQRFSFLD